jgi:hypothetical protein
MRFRSIKRWEMKPELDGLLFFAQRMNELLWDFTLDSYKPPTLNAQALCSEAVELTEDIESGLINPANLKPVLEELIWSVRADSVARALLDNPIERYVEINEDIKMGEQRQRFEVLGRTLDPYRYLHECFDQLCLAVAEVRKKDIDHIARTMVTSLLNLGMSRKHLYEKTGEFFFSNDGPKITAASSIRDFIKVIYPYGHDFDVYFVASKLINDVKKSVSAFRIEILNELPPKIAEFAKAQKFVVGPDEVFVHVSKLKGLDAYSAHTEAASRLDELSDLFTLFYHQNRISWGEKAIVSQCCKTGPEVIEILSSPMTKSFDLKPERASKELNRLLANFRMRGSAFKRFNRVADLHGICVASDVPENQLVNLWTSLETLVPSHTDQPKIVNIINSAMPFLLHNYIRGLVRRLSHNLVTWRPWTAKRILNKVEGINKPDAVLRTLALLCVSANQELRDELYAELKDYHLLRFRVFSMSELIKTPRKAMEAIENHQRKVAWQLHRLYRTRNLIVHSGRKPNYLSSLIENGHEYLDQILFDAIRLSCSTYMAGTLEQVFRLARMRFLRFTDTLAGLSTFDCDNCQFLCDSSDALPDNSISWVAGQQSQHTNVVA